MTTTRPSQPQMLALAKFLFEFQKPGFEPRKALRGGEYENGCMNAFWVEYNETVEAFIKTASQACWSDPNYSINEVQRMLNCPDAIANASVADIQSMITYCIRGERFCDGHIGAMILDGKVTAILKRLLDLSKERSLS